MPVQTPEEKQYITVAVPTPLHQLFTYTASGTIEPGVRVKVPFGPRSVIGVVMKSADQPEIELKSYRMVKEVIDKSPVYDPNLLQLATWMSQYYLHPIGEVLRAMLPAGSKSSRKISFVLSDKGREFVASNLEHSEILRHCFGKREKLTQTTLRKKLKSWPEDASDLEKWFQNKGYLKRESIKSVAARKSTSKGMGESIAHLETTPLQFTEEQETAFKTICDQGIFAAEKRPILLRGVTGSGKTEVYLRLISQVVEMDTRSQVLMMVPEISLTPQMTRVFTARFPEQIAVVHSGLSETERWERLESVRKGEKRVLIGPRSAVFASFTNLKLILVDEEHDQSYKQATGLQYSGRDVAVMRARIEGATIVLGSATPSLESYHNAKSNKYILCELNSRARGNPLPTVQLVKSEISKSARYLNSSTDLETVDDVPISEEIIEELRANHASGHQSIVIVNRRGFAYYLYDMEEKQPFLCPDCSVSLTVHGRNSFLKCHYCEYKTPISKILSENPEKSFVVMGYGSQKAEAFLKEKITGAKIVRLDSDTAMQKDLLPDTLLKFKNEEIDILVGTQILAKGHDFPKVTLMAIIEVDKQMSLPDFRAGERSFQLLVQASGRAGRAEEPGRVLIQTSKPENTIIQLAIEQNFTKFADHEIEFRRAHEFPPFTRLIAVEYSSEEMGKLMKFDNEVEKWLEIYEKNSPTMNGQLAITGPLYPPIQTIRGRHRRQILYRDSDPVNLRKAVSHFLNSFQKLPGDIRMKVDVDPQSML